MRQILNIHFTSALEAICTFDDNTSKKINLEEIAKSSVFGFLNDYNHTKFLVNRNYFIEWPIYEADLTADTLWHL